MNTDSKYREVVLGEINDLRNCLEKADDIETARHCRIRLSEALTFAMKLDLLEPTKATEIGVKADHLIESKFKN
jgi:hypothetical protein